MRNHKIIGLTGPTGSGKSAVAKYFEENGYKIIDADKIAREVTSKGSPCLKTLTAVFGKEILNEDNSLNRKILARIAFSTKENTQLLNDITHPFVYLKVIKIANEYIANGNTKIIYDAPLLFESNGELLCDYVISVLCSKEQRIKRIMRRDNIPLEQANLRINAQHSDDFYKNKSDFCIDNNSDLENLHVNVQKILTEIR
ncbi:MAG: dephospho-CoA kinase [Ruminococcus sp.]|nr:dephospho-CoA kinase [Ruminococcus sp.]